MNQRLKGQDTTVLMSQSGIGVLSQLDSIQDLELTIKLDLLQEGYLGETTDRYDDIFKGMAGTFTAHMTTAKIYDIVQAIIDRARRRTPGTTFNLKTTLQFPNGERRRAIIDNLFFSEIPNAFPKREEYASIKFTFASSSGRFI